MRNQMYFFTNQYWYISKDISIHNLFNKIWLLTIHLQCIYTFCIYMYIFNFLIFWIILLFNWMNFLFIIYRRGIHIIWPYNKYPGTKICHIICIPLSFTKMRCCTQCIKKLFWYSEGGIHIIWPYNKYPGTKIAI